jgi:hypothetical protein
MNARLRPILPTGHPNHFDAPEPKFDLHDDDLLRDLCGKHLGPAIQSLLIGLSLHEMNPGGDDYLASYARDVRKALIKTWEEDI